MRIFLLPLTTRQALVYCQRAKPIEGAKRSIAERINTKATDTWAKWEKAEKGWQKQVVTYGNRALQRIPYQEWGLKSFPAVTGDIGASHIVDNKKFEVVYPENVMDVQDAPKVLARLARDRKSLHFNRFWGSLVAMPFTIPFALIPIIPNLPFFYVAYRAWSHWRALKGSDHLSFLVDHKLLKFVSTPEVEGIYSKTAPREEDTFEFVTRADIEEGNVKEERKLLTAGMHNEVASVLVVPELSGEVERAVWQIDQEFQKIKEAQQQAKAQETKQIEKPPNKPDVK